METEVSDPVKVQPSLSAGEIQDYLAHYANRLSIAFEDYPARRMNNSDIKAGRIEADHERIRLFLDMEVPASIWLTLTSMDEFGFQHVRLFDDSGTILVAPFTVECFCATPLKTTTRIVDDLHIRKFKTKLRVTLTRIRDDRRKTNAECRQAALLERDGSQVPD